MDGFERVSNIPAAERWRQGEGDGRGELYVADKLADADTTMNDRGEDDERISFP